MDEEPRETRDHYRGHTAVSALSLSQVRGRGNFGDLLTDSGTGMTLGFIFQQGVTDDVSCFLKDRCMKNRMKK